METFYYFMQALPECMGLIALSLALAQVPLRWGRILIAGALVALLTFGIRSLPITFGFHLPISILVIFLAIIKSTKVRPSRAIIAVFFSYFNLALLETIVSNVYFSYTHMNYQQAITHEASWAAVGVFQSIILNLSALVATRFLRSSEGAWKI